MNLFPPIEPYNEFMFPVSNIHMVHVEESGNPEGKPAVFLHGGPGGGIDPSYRQYFDPDKWRLVLIDQRGCGKSTPFAELRENTTWDLVADIEKIRTHLNIDSWVVFGGSWGSTLSLAYAETHPEHVKGLILRGIFLLRQKELTWFYQDGASRIFPDAWEYYIAPIPEAERVNYLKAFYTRLTSEEEKIRLEAARAWSIWEGSTSKLIPNEQVIERFGEDRYAEALARIECHYFVNQGFFETDDQLLKNINAIRHIPAVIVQGRYDMVCPLGTAWELHQSWPEAEFIIVGNAGHSMSETGIRTRLVEATEKFSKL